MIKNLPSRFEDIREINTFLETKNNENMMVKNLEDATKAVLRGKCIVIKISNSRLPFCPPQFPEPKF